MDRLFLEARYKQEFDIAPKIIDTLPNSVSLATAIQFIGSIDKIRSSIESSGRTVKLIQGSHSQYPGQILGCDVHQQKVPDTECVLYIGTGRFHPLALAWKFKKKTFSFDPIANSFNEIKQSEIKKFEAKRDSALMHFYSASTVGIVKSLKQSFNQSKIDNLLAKYPDKNFYNFVADDIDFLQLNNFPFIDTWVNTACPRITYDDYEKIDKPIADIQDLI